MKVLFLTLAVSFFSLRLIACEYFEYEKKSFVFHADEIIAIWELDPFKTEYSDETSYAVIGNSFLLKGQVYEILHKIDEPDNPRIRCSVDKRPDVFLLRLRLRETYKYFSIRENILAELIAEKKFIEQS